MRLWMVGGFVLATALVALGAEDSGGLVVEGGSLITFGKLKVMDAEIELDSEAFNPQAAVEYRLPNSKVSVGFAYGAVENSFDLDYDDGEKVIKGSLDAERTDMIPYVRFGKKDEFNLRLGYRMLEYDFSNGDLDEWKNGVQTKQIRYGTAKGELTTGIDAELNIVMGDTIQFRLMIGGSYFIDADYQWSYVDELEGGALKTGNATLNAFSARIAPELSLRLGEYLRVFANYTVSATRWVGSREDEDEEYVGTDLVAGLVAGARLTVNF